MVLISEILIEEYQLASFTDLKLAVQQRAAQGERFLRFDIKPQFADTPEDWEAVLESIFTARI